MLTGGMLNPSPLMIGKGLTAPVGFRGQGDENRTEKTVSHTFLLCIAKMAKLSQYCTPHVNRKGLSLRFLTRVNFNLKLN